MLESVTDQEVGVLGRISTRHAGPTAPRGWRADVVIAKQGVYDDRAGSHARGNKNQWAAARAPTPISTTLMT